MQLNTESYHSYIRNVGNKLKSDPKFFWKYVNSSRKEISLQRLMSYQGKTATDNKNISNLFADFFQSVYTQHDSNVIDMTYSIDNSNLFRPDEMTISMTEIYETLMTLDMNKGAGPDGIPIFFMKSIASNIVRPLCVIFEMSLKKGIFPNVWKKSYVTPIFKSGTKSDIMNYRGISILSAMPKLFEKLICDKLTGFVLRFVNSAQHGFVKGKSCETNLTTFMNFLMKNMEDGYQIDTIYTDFSKAFDRVHHGLLLRKLGTLGVPSFFIRWLSSYLINRSQYVNLYGHISKCINVTSGVPQGSHLGPLLFVLYINDLCDVLKDCMFLLYADDLKIFKKITTIEGAIILQDNFGAIDNWCKNNHMDLNIAKCKCITFSRKPQQYKIIYDYGLHGNNIIRCSLMNDLGILIDEKINMNEHVDCITNKARRMLAFVKRQAKSFNEPYILKSLYCALIRPLMEYCAVAWAPSTKTQMDKIESVQRQFLLFALKNLGWRHAYELPSYESRLKLLNMDSLQNRRIVSCSIFMYKLMNQVINVPSLSNQLVYNESIYQTRNRHTFVQPPHSTNYGMNEPLTRLVKLYNLYEVDFLASNSVNMLKTRIRNKL